MTDERESRFAKKDEEAVSKDDSFRHLPWLKLPAPIKALFDHFPLIQYDRNELPFARTGPNYRHTLYIFTTEQDARNGAPSFNPTCLKWQVYLRFQSIEFATHPSSNHASPTGALPFLIPQLKEGAKVDPIPAKKLRTWVEQGASGRPVKKDDSGMQTGSENDSDADMRYDAYMSLLDHRIGQAYLHSLYICQSNFIKITKPLYIENTTSTRAVRELQARQLRAIARSELLKRNAVIDAEAIYRECDSAFEALSTLLADSAFFFGKNTPGLLDAALLGYTNLLLDSRFEWQDSRMRDALKKYQNLVLHRERILQDFFPAP